MKYLLDTNTCIYLIKRQYPEILAKLLKVGFENIGISAITLAELEYGIANSSRSMESQTALLEFILPFEILDFTYTAASFYGRIRKELKDMGRPIGDMDMLIASIAMANDLIVVTNNEKEFRRISGLRIENWKN
jgi:tRNA(fMet)-specific endonuclease VapC